MPEITEIAAAAAFTAFHLLALLLLTVTAYVAGRAVTRPVVRLETESAAGRFAVATALGLTILGHAAFLLGLLGLLARGPLLLVAAGVHLAGLPVWKETWREIWRAGRTLLAGPSGRRRLGIGVGLLLALAPLFLLALYPPTGFDETLYHLPFARAFARSGGVPFLPEIRVPVFPQLSELLFTALLLLAGDVTTHLVELLATLTTAVLLLGWGRRVQSSAVGWLAAAIWLGNPIAVHLAGTAYVEPGLALFTAAAFYAEERWRESGARGWLVLAGVFAGSAAGTKYLGIAVAGILFLLFILGAPRGRRLRDPLLFVLAAAAVAAPWYARILYYTGNPIFPFFPGLLGGRPTPWDTGGTPVHRTLMQRLEGFVRLPWSVVFDRRAVGLQPPYSPVYLLGLPLLAAAAWRDARVRRLLGFAVAYSLLFLLLPPDSRYLVPALPALALALALSFPEARRSRPRLLAALAVAAFLPGWLYAGYRIVQQGAIPVSPAARDHYLAQRLPVWPAVRFLNRTRGSAYTVYAFHAENMVYLAEGTLLGDWNGPARFALVEPLARDPAALHRKLRALGAGYLLVVDATGVPLPYDDPPFRALFRRIYSDGVSEVFEVLPVRASAAS